MLLIDGERIRVRTCDFIPFSFIHCDFAGTAIWSSRGALNATSMTVLKPILLGRFSLYFILIGGLVETTTYRFSIHYAGVFVVGFFSF